MTEDDTFRILGRISFQEMRLKIIKFNSEFTPKKHPDSPRRGELLENLCNKYGWNSHEYETQWEDWYISQVAAGKIQDE